MIKLDDVVVEQKHFGDNTLNLKVDPDIYFNHKTRKISWLYENDAELFTIICLAKKFSNYNLYLDLYYLPHARMDRVKNNEDVFTLKYFCEVINSLNFKKVTILDPHSDVGPALLNNVIVLNPKIFINNAINQMSEDIIIVFPDNGAEKRYSSLIPNNIKFTYCVKHRDWKTGRISDLTLMNPEIVKGKPVLIIDDICSYGGTFDQATNAIMKAGTTEVYLYVTHCEDNIFKGNLLKNPNIKKVYTTNTILHSQSKKIEFVSNF